MAGCLCDKCAALCCRYIALPIDNPETKRQYDDIRWYLVHENIVVFIEKKQWYVGVLNRCKHLQDDNRCGIYEIRPRICREYSTDNCDYHGGEYDFEKLFTSADQLWEYALEQLEKRKRKKQRQRLREKLAGVRAAKEKAQRKEKPRKPQRPSLRVLARVNGNAAAGNGRANGVISRNGRGISLPLLRQ